MSMLEKNFGMKLETSDLKYFVGGVERERLQTDKDTEIDTAGPIIDPIGYD